MTETQMTALKAVADAIVDAVKASGPAGAPAGPMYAYFMTAGWSLEQFEQIMAGLVRAGKLRKSGPLYFAVGAR